MSFLLRLSISLGLIATLTFLEISQGHTQQRQPSSSDKAEAVKTRKDALYQEIVNLNKNKACFGDGECEVLETGARLCGGPSGHIVVSNSNPAISTLKAKVKETSAVEKELNLIEPPNDCTPAPKAPEAKCVKQVCETK